MTDPHAADEAPLRLKWKHTWPGKGQDYAATTEGWEGTIGRVLIVGQGPQQGRWQWSMYASSPELSRYKGITSGIADSPREAAHCVERAWFAAIQGTSFDRPAPEPEPTRNAYAAAKAR